MPDLRRVIARLGHVTPSRAPLCAPVAEWSRPAPAIFPNENASAALVGWWGIRDPKTTKTVLPKIVA